MTSRQSDRGRLILRGAGKVALVIAGLLLFAGCSHKEEIARLKAEARKAESAGQHQKALAQWSSILKLDSKNGEAWLERAMIHQTIGKWPEAIVDYTAYLKLPPWRPGLNERLAMRLGLNLSSNPAQQTERWFVLCQRAFLYGKMGQFAKAEADLGEAVRLEPSSAMVQVTRAEVYQMKGDAEAALAALDRAVKVAPEEALGYTYRGAFLFQRGKLSQAMTNLDKALAIDPQDTRALMYRGVSYSRLGQFDQALADLDKAVKAGAQEPDAYAYRGAVLLQVGEYKEALDDFNTVLIFRPNDPKGLAQRGLALAQKGEIALALSDFDAAIKLNPAESYFYAWRGMAFFETNQFNRALEDLNHALEINPREAAFYRARGRTYLKQHRYEQALADIEHCVALNSDSPDSRNAMAWFRATCPDAAFRNGAEALKLAKEACELTRFSSWAAVDTLAAAYAETGEYDQAVKYQKQALGLLGVPKKKRVEMQKRLELYQQKRPFREES